LDLPKQQVNLHLVGLLLSSLDGLGDVDEYVEAYRSLDVNDANQVRSVIRREIVPIYLRLTERGRREVKLSLRYFLTKSHTNFSGLFGMMPFGPPTNARDFFVWVWEELFGEEDHHFADLRLYQRSDSFNEYLRVSRDLSTLNGMWEPGKDFMIGILNRLPRVPLALAPTPLHPLDRLRDALGGPERVPRLLIKRDDLNGVALGGNKLRKLEWLLGDAQAQGCDTLITAGAAQSNHCRQTAAVGAMYGMETHLCLRGPEPDHRTGNLILDDWLGAHLHFAPPGASVSDAMLPLAEALRAKGRKPYVIPIGGSNAVGAVGYVAAVAEMAGQGDAPDYLVVATGSGGTQAGQEVGVRLLGLPTKVIGIGVAEPDTVSWNVDVANLANAVAERLGTELRLSSDEIECPMDWMGPHYAAPTPSCEDAIRFLARTEGVFADPVYSGKALDALLDGCRSGRFAPNETVVFWHTGGTPALFAEGH
jgi:D-cysteine desulfhydrase family pyridoxal phosphate-dependent enzyme